MDPPALAVSREHQLPALHFVGKVEPLFLLAAGFGAECRDQSLTVGFYVDRAIDQHIATEGGKIVGEYRATGQVAPIRKLRHFSEIAHLDKGVKADGIFWADFGESLGEKFNEWLLQ